MSADFNAKIDTKKYEDKKAKRFIETFNEWIEDYIVGDGETEINDMLLIMDRDAMTLYSSYNSLMGKWFNKPDSKSDDAKWLNNLGKKLKRRDDKIIPRYRTLRNKIAKMSKLKDEKKKTKQINSIKKEVKELFQDAWDSLKKILDDAADETETVANEYKMSEKEESYKNLVYICKEDIQSLIKALKYNFDDLESLYEYLGISSDYEKSRKEDFVITTSEKISEGSEIRKTFDSNINTFKSLISGEKVSNLHYSKELAPIILKGDFGSDKTATSISDLFSSSFSEFMSRGKGGKTSHTAKWCRSVLKDIQKHEKKFKPKYFALRKEIKAYSQSKPDSPSSSKNYEEETASKDKVFSEYYIALGEYNKKADLLKTKAIKLFEEARKSLQSVLDKAAKSARRTLSLTSTVFLKSKVVQDLANSFRNVKPDKNDNDALWKVLTKEK